MYTGEHPSEEELVNGRILETCGELGERYGAVTIAVNLKWREEEGLHGESRDSLFPLWTGPGHLGSFSHLLANAKSMHTTKFEPNLAEYSVTSVGTREAIATAPHDMKPLSG